MPRLLDCVQCRRPSPDCENGVRPNVIRRDPSLDLQLGDCPTDCPCDWLVSSCWSPDFTGGRCLGRTRPAHKSGILLEVDHEATDRVIPAPARNANAPGANASADWPLCQRMPLWQLPPQCCLRVFECAECAQNQVHQFAPFQGVAAAE